MIATTRPENSVSEPTLYVAFELGKKDWKLAMTSGFGIQPWLRSVTSGDWRAVERAIGQGRGRFGLVGVARVVSCDEAGRDGFWIHRALTARGIANRVVDSASIEVNRRARRAKTDRLEDPREERRRRRLHERELDSGPEHRRHEGHEGSRTSKKHIVIFVTSWCTPCALCSS